MRLLCVLLLLAASMQAQLARCHIAADNSKMPMITFPWNAVLCGYNAGGWVWLVGIDRWPDGKFFVNAEYLPTFHDVGWVIIGKGQHAIFAAPGDDGQRIGVSITKVSGNAKDSRNLKVWADIWGVYSIR